MKVVSAEKPSSRNDVLDYILNSVINDPDNRNNTKSPHKSYSKIVELFKPAYPWLTSNILAVNVHRTRKKLEVISKQDRTTTNIQQMLNHTSNMSFQQ